MTSSQATLGPSSNPSEYQGRITALQGTGISARVKNASGQAIGLAVQLQIDPGSSTASGTVSASPARAGTG